MKLALVFSCALALFTIPAFAQPVAVTASITGSATNGWTYTGMATGTLDGDILALDQGTLQLNNPGPPASVIRFGFVNNFDFSGPTGVYAFTSCTVISGANNLCDSFAPINAPWTTVTGNPQQFTTTAVLATFDWVVTEVASVPTLPGYGLAMVVLGMLLVASRSLYKQHVEER